MLPAFFMTENEQMVVPPGEPARSLRLSIYEGGAYTVMIAVTLSAIRTFFAQSLGATDADFSVITALAALGTMGAVVGPRLVRRFGSRKRGIMAAILSRNAWLPIAAIPFLALPPRWGLYALMAAVLFTTFVETMVGNAWMSWMTDLVPEERRGRYFGMRNAIHGGIAIAASWTVGHTFDFLRNPSRLGESKVYAPLFIFAGLCGMISARIMSRKWEPATHAEKPIPVFATLRLPFSHPAFRQLIIFYLLWTLVTFVSTPFWQPHMIKNLKMDGSTIAIYAILCGLFSLITQPAWGRIIDRFGNRPVLAINITVISCLPLLWLFARPGFLWCIWIDAILTGIFWPGFNLATFNIHLQTAPRENRQSYLATITVIIGITGFLASLLGGLIATNLARFHLQFFGFPLVNYHIIFVLSAIGRLAMLPLSLKLREERSQPVAAVLAVAGQKITATLDEALQSGVELIRRYTSNRKPGQ